MTQSGNRTEVWWMCSTYVGNTGSCKNTVGPRHHRKFTSFHFQSNPKIQLKLQIAKEYQAPYFKSKYDIRTIVSFISFIGSNCQMSQIHHSNFHLFQKVKFFSSSLYNKLNHTIFVVFPQIFQREVTFKVKVWINCWICRLDGPITDSCRFSSRPPISWLCWPRKKTFQLQKRL